MTNIRAMINPYEDLVISTYCKRYNVRREEAIKQIITAFGHNFLDKLIEEVRRGEVRRYDGDT